VWLVVFPVSRALQRHVRYPPLACWSSSVRAQSSFCTQEKCDFLRKKCTPVTRTFIKTTILQILTQIMSNITVIQGSPWDTHMFYITVLRPGSYCPHSTQEPGRCRRERSKFFFKKKLKLCVSLQTILPPAPFNF
jgi:hypothetical protein